MELSVKNDKLIGHFQAERDMVALRSENMEDPKVRAWSMDHPETMLYGYLDSFLEICEANKIEFDLTYNSVKNLGMGLVALYQVQKKSYDQPKNTDIISKTLAAVLSYLAINEHGCWFRTTSYLAQVKAGKALKQPLWADVLSIAVGRKNRYMDLLAAAKESVIPGSVMSPNGLSIQPAAIIAEYKKLTGVDLVEHGIASIFMN